MRRKIQLVTHYLPYSPFLVEQTGLILHAWGQLPGPSTGQFLESVGTAGICKMVSRFEDRRATAVTYLGYHAANGEVDVFLGAIEGQIATGPRGDHAYGWAALFVPDGYDQTLAEMTFEKRIDISTRMKATSAFYTAVFKEDDASKSKAVSYKRLLAIEAYLQTEVNELFALSEAADGGQLPDEMNIPDEIERREQQLERLAEAKKVLEVRAQARYAAEKAEYEAKMRAREEKAANKGRKPPGRPPKPPTPGPRDKDQYNFTDPESRIMKNANNSGFDQHYNTQVVVEHDSRLIVGNWLCNHTNDKQAALPTIDTVPPEVGQPKKANLDTGYFSKNNIADLEARGIDPYIATGRSPHHQGWRAFFLDNPDPPTDDASVKEQMAYKLRTEIGNALYRLCKSTVEPVIGIIKEVLGFRQFSLRGLCAAGGEWTLVCLAYNLKRLHTLQVG